MLDGLVRDDVEGGQFRVHRRVFVDQPIYDVERDRVFNHSWLYVGHVSEVANPGAYQIRKVANRNVILVRGEDRQVRVLLNQCTHRGTLLCREQRGETKFFRCPYHAWTFDVSGKLTAVPDEDSYGEGWDKGGFNLKEVPRTENYRGFVFVSFDREIAPFADSLQGAREYLDLVCDQQPEDGWEVLPGTHKYSIPANWKLLVENFVDNYHFAILHNRYLQYMRSIGVSVGPQGARSGISRSASLGNGHGACEHQQLASLGRLAGHWGGMLPEWTKEPLAEIRKKLEERVGVERAYRIAQTNRNLRIFPTFYLFDHISPVIRVMNPVGVDCTEVQEWVLGPKGESPEMRALRMRNYNLQVGPGGFVSPDDIEVLALTQEGLKNPELEWLDDSRGMKLGRTLSNDEQQVRGLHRHWHELMTLGRVTHPVNV